MFVLYKRCQAARLLSIIALVMSVASVRADTLADALIGAYSHSGLLEQNRALLRVADENVAQAQAALRPILTYQTTIQSTWTQNGTYTTDFLTGVRTLSRTTTDTAIYQTSLNAQWLLFDNGASRFRSEAAKEAVLSTRAQLLSLEQQVLIRAVAAFFNVRQASETVALRQNNLRLLTEEMRAAKDRFEVGEVTRTDVALAEARLAQARSGLATAQGDLLQAQAEYTAVTGRSPGQLAPPPRLPKLINNIDAAISQAVRRHPDMDAAQRLVSQTELLIKAATADLDPTLSLTGQLSSTEQLSSSSFSSSGTVGLNLSGPIYRGGRLSSLVRQARAQRDAQRGNLHNVRHVVQQNVRNALANVASTTASIEASQEQIRAARVAFRGVREEATLGARTTLDVLDAEQELLNAQAALITAEAQQYIAAYTVLQSIGRLTARDLRLNVKIYDPKAYYDLVKDGPAARSKQGAQLDRVLRKLYPD